VGHVVEMHPTGEKSKLLFNRNKPIGASPRRDYVVKRMVSLKEEKI
jgi:hypothetical protein